MNVRSALITGASSGIGAALAAALARQGVVLHLSGRDAGRLEAVADVCRAQGAAVHATTLDVRERQAMVAWIEAAAPLDLVVANAGISGRSRIGEAEDPSSTRDIFDINVDGVLSTVTPAMAVMESQPQGADGFRGRIAVVASIAAFLASPDSAAYCASKAAVDRWTRARAPAARRQGILLTSVCPGFIRTRMTTGYQFPMPGLMDAERAAHIMLRGIAAGRARIVFPWWMGAAARIAGLLPPRLLEAATPARVAGHSRSRLSD
jgi:short-subunit dehydrogenase